METITTEEEAKRFIRGEYDQEVLHYLKAEVLPSQNSVNCYHVLECLKGAVGQLFGICQAGDFVQALLSNDLMVTVGRADAINVMSLNLYAMFLKNKVPAQRLQEARLKER